MADNQLHSGDQTHEVIVNERRSIRGYKKQPVPKALLEEVIEIAMILW